MGAILTAARLGIFGQVAQHRLPCTSDADPGEMDEQQAQMLACIEEAETFLAMARDLVEQGHFVQAQDRMNEAIGWLREEME